MSKIDRRGDRYNKIDKSGETREERRAAQEDIRDVLIIEAGIEARRKEKLREQSDYPDPDIPGLDEWTVRFYQSRFPDATEAPRDDRRTAEQVTRNYRTDKRKREIVSARRDETERRKTEPVHPFTKPAWQQAAAIRELRAQAMADTTAGESNGHDIQEPGRKQKREKQVLIVVPAFQEPLQIANGHARLRTPIRTPQSTGRK